MDSEAAYAKSSDPVVSSAALKAPVVKAFLLDLPIPAPSTIWGDAGSAVFGLGGWFMYCTRLLSTVKRLWTCVTCVIFYSGPVAVNNSPL